MNFLRISKAVPNTAILHHQQIVLDLNDADRAGTRYTLRVWDADSRHEFVLRLSPGDIVRITQALHAIERHPA